MFFPAIRLLGALSVSTRLLGSTGASLLIWFMSRDGVYALIALVFSLFSYLFNDLCDREKDRLAHPKRPLPAGILSARAAAISSFVLFGGGIVTTLALRPELFPFFSILFPASALYSVALKKWLPALATPWWCLLGTSLLLMPIQPGLWQFSGVFCFFFARELLLDFRDRKADRYFCETPTLPLLLGHHTFTFVFVLQLWALVASAVLKSPILLAGNAIISLFLVKLIIAAFRRGPKESLDDRELPELRLTKNIMWVGFLMAAAL